MKPECEECINGLYPENPRVSVPRHGFKSICETCANFDYLEAQKERIDPPLSEQPAHRLILRGELNQLKGELMYITNKINEHIDRSKRSKRNVI